MALSPTLSTVEAIVPATGALPDTLATVTLRVTVRDTAGAIPSGPVQVRVVPTQNANYYVDHAEVWAANADTAFSYTDALGVADIPLRSGTAGTTGYQVFVGEDDGLIPVSAPGAGLVGKPERDFVVGPPGTTFAHTYTTPQTIDTAWVAANFPTGIIESALFVGQVTLAARGFTFRNCGFATSALESYSLRTNGYVCTYENCYFRGGGAASIYGAGGTYVRCAIVASYKHGVHIVQSGAVFPDDFTPTVFQSCLWRFTGISEDAYALYGGPMRNVVVDHCWFDVRYSTSATPPQRCVSAIYQDTAADGARGPQVWSSWFNGGKDAYIQFHDGAATPPEFIAVRACRFGALSELTGTSPTYVIDQSTNYVTDRCHGNMSDVDGRLISNTTYPATNVAPGARFLWPSISLATVPQVTWSEASTGGGTGGGGGGGTNTGGGTNPPLLLDDPDEELVCSVRIPWDLPQGGGGGTRIVSIHKVTDGVVSATPIPLDGGGTSTPIDPLTVEWQSTQVWTFEGATVQVHAELFTAAGATPSLAQLGGFEVPVSVTYTATGSGIGGATAASSADVTVGGTVSFGVGESIGTLTIDVVDDVSPEGVEVFRVDLEELHGTTPTGQSTVIVQPGASYQMFVAIDVSDPLPTVRTVNFETAAISIGEGADPPTVQAFVAISGNPDGQVLVRATFSGTATRGIDYIIEDPPPIPTAPNTVVLRFNPTANGSTPASQPIRIRVVDETLDEADETVVMTLTTLTPTYGVIGSQATCTVTIVDDDEPPAVNPDVGFFTTSYAVRESSGIGVLTQVQIVLHSWNNEVFTTDTPVGVEFVDGTATFGEDYDVVGITWGSGGTHPHGTVLWPANSVQASFTLTITPDTTAEGAGEFFTMRLLDGAGYTVRAASRESVVTILEPLGGETELFVATAHTTNPTAVNERLEGHSGPTLMRASLYVGTEYDPASGFRFKVPGDETGVTCQWHPVAYKPDGTPDIVHCFALLDHNGESIPGTGSAVTADASTGATPALPIDVATQYSEIEGVKLVLVHDVNGESRSFELGLTGATTIVDGPSVNTHGGGPAYFRRYVKRDGLSVSGSSDYVNDRCTVARMYADCRCDVDVVVLAVNWGNFAWLQPDGADTHYQANDAVDGEVFFKYLWLDNIPSGWSAVHIDPNTTRSTVGASRVEIIKANSTASKRHYLPPLRGHMTYIALYKTATVSAATANSVLRGYDIAYAVGGLGVDRNDALGEYGTPAGNYAAIGFVNLNNAGGGGQAGWAGAAQFAEDERNRARNAIILGNDTTYTGRQRGWWIGFGDPPGDNPGGIGVNVSAGTMPGRYKWEGERLELIHLWHRTGTTAWTARGGYVTDEDFTIPSGTTRVMCTAQWQGKGGQRYTHQQFWVPDTRTTGSAGVAPSLRLAPGRSRAYGTVTLNAIPADGTWVEIPDGYHTTRRYIFVDTLLADSSPNYYVQRSTASVSANVAALVAKVNAGAGPSTYCLRAWQDTATAHIANLFHGTTGNDTIDTSTPATFDVNGMTGGSNGTNVRPWNYQTQGSTSCDYDIDLSWFARGIDEDMPSAAGVPFGTFHIFDWSHMARIGRPCRDLWWLALDPLAWDVIQDLGALGTQCMPRYAPDARSGVGFMLTSEDQVQLVSAAVGTNLRAINQGYQQRLGMHFIRLGYDSNHATTDADATQAVNVGWWVIRNPAHLGAFDPATALDWQLVQSEQEPLDRSVGWLMCFVARYYCTSPALQTVSTAFDVRTLLHPSATTIWSSDRPSWFEALRAVIAQTIHRSGAISSDETGRNTGFYNTASYGPVDFGVRVGAFPGGPVNVAVQPAQDDEWWSHTRMFHHTYVAVGAYAIGRRVYTHVDQATTTAPTDAWHTVASKLYDYGRLQYLSARAWQGGGSSYWVSASTPSHVGSLALQATGGNNKGRFNLETGAGNPLVTFRDLRSFWWHTYGYPGIGKTAYDAEYWLIFFCHWRTHALTRNEFRDLIAGPHGFGGQDLTAIASTVRLALTGLTSSGTPITTVNETYLTPLIPVIRSPSTRYLGGPDELVWLIQFILNEFE